MILSEDRYSEYNKSGHPEYHTLHILTNPERGEDVSFIINKFPGGWGGSNSQFFSDILASGGNNSMVFYEGRACSVFCFRLNF